MKYLIILLLFFCFGCHNNSNDELDNLEKEYTEICIHNVIYYQFYKRIPQYFIVPAYNQNGSVRTCK